MKFHVEFHGKNDQPRKNLDRLIIYFFLNQILWAFSWKALSTSICCENINNSLFHIQYVLDLFFFFKQFQSYCVYKVFPSTKNNRLRYYHFWFVGIKYIRCNLSLGLWIFQRDSFPCGHLSEGELCRWQINWKIILLEGNFQGDIVRGQLSSFYHCISQVWWL